MKHAALDELRLKADVGPSETEVRKLTRRERLERWATVLEQYPGRVRPFIRIEGLSHEERKALRGDDTPLAVAFKDPVLRADGLSSDRLGDAMGYFELSEQDTHRLLCDCHYRGTMTGVGLGARLRAVARGNVFQRLWDWATGSGDGR
jgi:hypothetical protein